MDLETLVRAAGPPVLAALGALAVDRMTTRRGLAPPGFARPWRRGLAALALAGVFWIGVFAPVAALGQERTIDFGAIPTPQLFLLHVLMMAALVGWYLLGFAGAGEAPGRRFAVQFGFRAPAVARELGLGVAAGVAAWLAVIVAMLGVAGLLWILGGEEWLPSGPPAMIPWIAGLPIAVRAGVSLSAGLVEETFFRGFLQPRVGIALSTVFFALAHLSYDQPLMLVGVTMLSLVFALLVRWRQSIWAAAAAHATFDAVQLLFVIPAALEMLGERATGPIAWQAFW